MEASNNKQEVVIRRKQENKTSEEDEKNKSQVNKGLLKNRKMAFIKKLHSTTKYNIIKQK